MAGITGKTPSATYKDLLKIENSNSGVDDTLRQVESGDGTGSALYIEKNSVKIAPTIDDTALLSVKDKSGSTMFNVDTSTPSAQALGNNINTQYAYFGMGYSGTSSWAANTHYPLIYNSHYISSSLADVDFGTGTDPDDSFTAADTDTQYASQIVPMIWRVVDNITIDSVTHIEGADNATGDTTRMHLKSFNFLSGISTCLANGELLAHSSDITNTGNEKPFLNNWTIDSADVVSTKAILCFFRSDSVNSDYSINVTIKYHLT